MKDYKKYYQHFLGQHPNEYYFTSHSHHFWPDVTRNAQLQYWDDTARLVDDKWGYFFGEVMNKTRRHLARLLHLQNGDHLIFAPNTHELCFRLLSSFFEKEHISVVTTDSEFYSFSRQIQRLEEWNKFSVKYLSPANSSEFLSQLQKSKGDVLFLSQVFFNSGIYLSLEDLSSAIEAFPGIVIIDGYHSFGAIPLNLAPYADKIYFTAGSYKYAQGGEGLCFLHSPSKTSLRPIDTGWFAEMSSLSQEQQSGRVSFPQDGFRFAGSTMDMTAFYRFNAVWDLFEQESISIESIHQHVQELQQHFLDQIADKKSLVSQATLLNADKKRGHFLAFQFPHENEAFSAEKLLRARKIYTDRRGAVLRLGMGLPHGPEDIQHLVRNILL